MTTAVVVGAGPPPSGAELVVIVWPPTVIAGKSVDEIAMGAFVDGGFGAGSSVVCGSAGAAPAADSSTETALVVVVGCGEIAGLFAGALVTPGSESGIFDEAWMLAGSLAVFALLIEGAGAFVDASAADCSTESAFVVVVGCGKIAGSDAGSFVEA